MKWLAENRRSPAMYCLVIAVAAVVIPAFPSGKIGRDTYQTLAGGWPTSTLLNINQISVWARNDGWSARDPASGNSGLMFPRAKVAAVFQDGILWSGKVSDGGSPEIRAGGQAYAIGTIAGRIVSRGIPADSSDDTKRIFRIRSDFRTADLRLDAAELNRVIVDEVTLEMISALRTQYERDWNEWPWEHGAPFYDTNNNGVCDIGESPGLANADQVVWYVANDLNEGRTMALYGSLPVGLEMQVTMWGYRAVEAPWSTTFLKRVRLIYKGLAETQASARIDSMFLGQWSSTDLGDAGDNFAGCDTTLALNYVYNGRDFDLEYMKIRWPPPAIGYHLVQMPVVSGSPSDSAIVDLRYVRGKKHVQVYSMTYARPTFGDPIFPVVPQYLYNWMRGLEFVSGRPYVHTRFPGDTTRFWADGDPVTGTGRLDSSYGDRRILACAGPFTMALGDTQEIVIATIGAVGPSHVESVRELRRFAIAVRSDFEDLLGGMSANPDLSSPPPVRFFLHQNYPNPFNPTTTIRYEVGFRLRVLVRVFDILGREVSRLVDEVKEPGDYEAVWDGAGCSSGVYIFSIEAGPYVRSKKGILLR